MIEQPTSRIELLGYQIHHKTYTSFQYSQRILTRIIYFYVNSVKKSRSQLSRWTAKIRLLLNNYKEVIQVLPLQNLLTASYCLPSKWSWNCRYRLSAWLIGSLGRNGLHTDWSVKSFANNHTSTAMIQLNIT